ncbi:hypothetical protein ACFP1I_18065 [Dyadobacter subterraneus]|uniref:Tetratricopeptide repeat protein n=1 Tax=Dyadobacter subterraneus TaxID=2773304 RepID=A0ABR9WGW6_9BACT|nr:hypothetical protein [Dyadobacter subterraneus]MBE9464738.1 hypothetical protein [Dyadobacter subterraneus]
MSKKQVLTRKSAPKPDRIIAFRVISMLLPFLLLFLVEIALRTFNYGNDLSLFIEYPQDKNYLFLNPDASKRYFSNQKNATTGNVEPFKKKKENGTLRFFVLGESTTIGYPYFHNGSFHRWLLYRLTHIYPDQKFEIVNISLTAVNSYTVAGFAKEVINYEPDAVLIYTGHNEYYGALGVGSTENIGGNRFLIKLILKLRELKIIQLITNFYDKIISTTSSKNPDSEGTRMQRMVSEQKIPYQSDLYKRGVEQFQGNMDETLELFSKHNIPVLISNLVSNEKDLKPFVSFPVDSTKFPGFSLNFKLGLKAFKNKNYNSAFNFFKAADKSYSENAESNYYLGKLTYASKNYNEARRYFSKAKDLDGLRFRAPDELNTILKNLSSKYSNAHLVDTKSIFETHAANQIIGDELILEHVHPDLMGYALMSDVFFDEIEKLKIIKTSGEKISFDVLLKEMPITKIDSLSGIYKVANLKSSWPFTGTMRSDSFKINSFEEKTAYELANRKISWLDAMDRAYNYYVENHDLVNARKTVETLILEYPTDAQYYLKSAMLSGEMKDEKNAVFNFKKAFSLSPTFDIARYLFVILLKLDKPAEAIPYLDYAVANNTSRFDLNPVKNSALNIIELKNTFSKDSSDKSAPLQIAKLYFKMQNKEGAEKYARKVLVLSPGNLEAKMIISGQVKP